MKKMSCVIFILLFIPSIEFAQIVEQKIKEFANHRITYDNDAKWPSQSFYQRKGEWQWIIDSTWGPGASTTQKLQVFDTYANYIQSNFALFYRLNLNWDSLKTFCRAQITDSTSHGGLLQILSHLAWSLEDEHSTPWNIEIGNTQITPGVPLFITPCWGVLDNNHFGAVLTANNNGEIFVIKTITNHPLGLEPGDVIVGYEGVRWMDIVSELMDFHIAILGTGPTNETARQHNLLISAGFNWHLFSTIDVVKYSTGDTLHLSLEPLIQIQENLINAEQMDIPGVPKPNFVNDEQGSYGIIDNSNIGYIYIYRHTTPSGLPNANVIFQQAITSLWNTDGLIIDLRFNQGGYTEINLNDGFDLLLNDTITELKHVKRCNTTELNLLCDYNPTWWTTTTPDPTTFYEKPVAILVGPRCLSMGDYIAYRLKNLPNGRFFGKTTSGALGVLGGYDNYLGWILYTQREDSYHPDEPYQYLSGDYFPVDEEIWLTKEDVANGYDTVVEDALNWINNLSYSHNAQIDKTFTQNLVQFTADVKNPNNHSLSVKANILSEGVLIDSLECTILNNQILETWGVPANEEHFYSVTIYTKDEITSTTHTLPNIVRFTNVGPVVLDSISISKVTEYYSVKPFVKNLSAARTITSASIKLICVDPWITSITPTSRPLPNIPPGAVVSPSSGFTVRVDSTFTNNFNFKVEISSANWPYWVDSLQVVVGVDVKESLPTEFTLEQNYPNPFNPKTKIGWQSPIGSHQIIKVYDILGNEVATLVDEYKPAGKNEVEFNDANLPTGVYFYQLKAGEYVNTKKMIILK